MAEEMRHAYSTRASEYVAALGSVEDMDALDIAFITDWGRNVVGPILDAGSGPGHWAGLLHSYGCDASGIDVVPEFVESARQRFPLVAFQEADIRAMPFEESSFGGVLAWYSLIHMRPEVRGQAFNEFARVLRPRGSLLVGAFLGPQGIGFDHAVTEAFYWSEKGLVDDLESTGFQVISTHARSTEGARPHLGVLARLD